MIDHLLQNLDKCSVRAVTRNPEGEKGLKLKERGVEVVKGDYNDVASLTEAFKGAYGVFCLTNFWELFKAELEMAHAKNIA